MYATEWVERTFDYVRSARTVLRKTGELNFIITLEERDFNPKKDIEDLGNISETITIYDSNFYVDAFYFIYQVKGELTHKIGHVYTEDLLGYNHNLITHEQIMDRLTYISLFDTETNAKDKP
jgi:hypothetical protein